MLHHVQYENTSECSNLLTAAWKAKTGHRLTPHTQSQVYFQPEPVNSWGGVSFDKWQGRPGSLLSCRHIVDSSVWSQTMCSDPSRISGHSLHPKCEHPPPPYRCPHSNQQLQVHFKWLLLFYVMSSWKLDLRSSKIILFLRFSDSFIKTLSEPTMKLIKHVSLRSTLIRQANII